MSRLSGGFPILAAIAISDRIDDGPDPGHGQTVFSGQFTMVGAVELPSDGPVKDRFVPMTERVKSLFESTDAGKGKDLVFPGRKGKIQTHVPSSFIRGVVDVKLNDNIEDPKLRASFHTLRHTYASRLVQAGVDLYRVQRLLGHSSPVMTARYSKLADDDLRQAVQTMERAAEIKKGAKVIRLRNRE